MTYSQFSQIKFSQVKFSQLLPKFSQDNTFKRFNHIPKQKFSQVDSLKILSIFQTNLPKVTFFPNICRKISQLIWSRTSPTIGFSQLKFFKKLILTKNHFKVSQQKVFPKLFQNFTKMFPNSPNKKQLFPNDIFKISQDQINWKSWRFPNLKTPSKYCPSEQPPCLASSGRMTACDVCNKVQTSVSNTGEHIRQWHVQLVAN